MLVKLVMNEEVSRNRNRNARCVSGLSNVVNKYEGLD